MFQHYQISKMDDHVSSIIQRPQLKADFEATVEIGL